MNDKIRLAKAMELSDETEWWYLEGMNIYEDAPVAKELAADLFEPFEDANHDYAVLEWMRNTQQGKFMWANFVAELRDNIELAGTASYVIGDYARAAWKVLPTEEK